METVLQIDTGDCDYPDVLPLAEYSCNKHHVCAFSRRPHIQLHVKDLQSSPTPPLFQAL